MERSVEWMWVGCACRGDPKLPDEDWEGRAWGRGPGLPTPSGIHTPSPCHLLRQEGQCLPHPQGAENTAL